MPTILVAECKQEVSSFNPLPSHYGDFRTDWGEDILHLHRGGILEMGGALSVFDARPDVHLVPTYSARARTSAGTLATADFRRIATEFLDPLRETPGVDGVYFSLHGAMAAEDEPDPEGYLLTEARKNLGERVPIVISLDLHAVLTDRMLEQSDGLTSLHTYPHQDFFDTGVRAANLLLKILDGQTRPVTARVFIPALVRGDELITETGLLGRFIRQAQGIQAAPHGLAAGMLIGNPFTDVPELGSCSYATTDNDPKLAEANALGLARGFWEVRHALHAELFSLDEAMRIAIETPGTTILTDAADAPSSGATGDSNAILRGLLNAGYSRPALLPIVDAPAVQAAMAAGIGATIRVPLGGTLDPGRFEPLTLEADVRMLSDGHYSSEYSDRRTDAGPTAVLGAGPITIVVTSRTVSLTDRSLFLAHGQDPKRFGAIVVKSPHCRAEFFSAWASKVMTVDVPGSTSANLPYLGHTKVRRPIFPLDEGVTFAPKARVFQRGR